MSHLEALELIAHHPHAWRFRELCDQANPDSRQRDDFRTHVIRLASDEDELARLDRAIAEAGTARDVFGCCG